MVEGGFLALQEKILSGKGHIACPKLTTIHKDAAQKNQVSPSVSSLILQRAHLPSKVFFLCIKGQRGKSKAK